MNSSFERRLEVLEAAAAANDCIRLVIVEDGETREAAIERVGIDPDNENYILVVFG